jgi:hypothetical protein
MNFCKKQHIMSNFSSIAVDLATTSPDRAGVAKRLYDAVARGDTYIILARNIAPDLLADIWASFECHAHPHGYKVMLPLAVTQSKL